MSGKSVKMSSDSRPSHQYIENYIKVKKFLIGFGFASSAFCRGGAPVTDTGETEKKMRKLNQEDLKVIKSALDDVYLEMVENLADHQEMTKVIIATLKVNSLIKSS